MRRGAGGTPSSEDAPRAKGEASPTPVGRGDSRGVTARGKRSVAHEDWGGEWPGVKARAGRFPNRRWTRVHTSVDHSTGWSDVFHWL